MDGAGIGIGAGLSEGKGVGLALAQCLGIEGGGSDLMRGRVIVGPGDRSALGNSQGRRTEGEVLDVDAASLGRRRVRCISAGIGRIGGGLGDGRHGARSSRSRSRRSATG